MRVMFICGSLELGKNGVGDYTRRLAGELISQHHEASIIAFNDSYLESKFEGFQSGGKVDIPVMRLPSNLSEAKRFYLANIWIKNINPEFISLQYVGFSFQPKGIPLIFGFRLAKLGRGRKWHFMFHELWVGAGKSSPKMHLVWGFFQRQIIVLILSTLKPMAIHTQSHLYKEMLSSLGAPAKYLPLFGNILKIKEQKGKSKRLEMGKENLTTFVVFGTVHPDVPIQAFVNELVNYSKNKGRSFELIMVGRCGVQQEHWVKCWEGAGFNVRIFGEQDASFISNILTTSSFGISTSAYYMIEKSGTVAAMREHGLPVICIGKEWKPRIEMEFQPPFGIIEYKKGNLEHCLSANLEPSGTLSISKISRDFIKDLRNI